jgi:hypothetical protein
LKALLHLFATGDHTLGMPMLRASGPLTLSNADRALVAGGSGCDLSELTFIDTYGLVVAAVSALDAIQHGHEDAVTRPKRDALAEHLSYMGVARTLDHLGIRHDLPDRDPADLPEVVTPLQIVTRVGDLDGPSDLLHAQLRSKVDPQVLDALTTALWELGANAIEHSGSHAVVAGQVYRHGLAPDHNDKIQIVVGDTGRGVRASFLETRKHVPADDAAAIDLALTHMVSSVPDPARGQGLSTTSKEAVGLQGGFVIRSGLAKLREERWESNAQSVPQLPGTVVAVSIPLWPGDS